MAKEDFYQEIDDEITFNIINQDTLNRLKRDGEIKVPKKVLDVPKDKRWNKKQMASKILQGLESGNSITDIAEAMKAVIGNNEVSAIRNTRTMTTSAENNGRLDSYKNLANQGVVMKKEWIATPDDRTRPTHLALDGEQIDLDKTFSNGCRFPGDAKGPAEEVWMCRCAMGTHIIGFRRADGSISKVDYQRDDTLHDKQVKAEKEQRKQIAKSAIPVTTNRVVNGKDISDTWKRRPDEFDFEIDDVINAQGFDGLPKVVDAEEFDRYVQESNFIAQRTYSAPDQETLDAYREQLYNGKWYVDCSTGGAAHGKGMYCVGNNGTDVTETMKNSMISYGGMSPNANIETFTLDSTAKIIKENDIKDLYSDLGINLMKRNLDGYNFSDDEIKFIASYGGIGDSNYVSDFLKNNSKRAIEIMQEVASNEKIADTVTEFIKITNDNGVVASMFGYDAIECAGGQDYYVILNRTKIIFKGE